MSVRVVVSAAAICLLAGSVASAESPFPGPAAREYGEYVRLVDSLRPDKPGQMRVFAFDGSEFTAGQAMWMKGQLRKVARLRASDAASDRAEATRLLAEVGELLRSHHRSS